MKIHIFGAAGAGSTTLGKLLSKRLSIKQIDVDDLAWDHTTRPYGKRLPRQAKISGLREAIAGNPAAVVTGSLCGWGDKLINGFDAGIFLCVPTYERLRRINRRQTENFGAEAIAVGGEYHNDHESLMTWAGLYDYSTPNMISYAQHRQWMRKRSYPILTLRGVAPPQLVADVAFTYMLQRPAMQHRTTLDLGVDDFQPNHYGPNTS